MTSEHRRYERLLRRQSRGLPLRPEEAAELAHAKATLPLARREHAVLDSLKQWFEATPSDAEKQALARLERAALVRARHNSRARLRLLLPDNPATSRWVRPDALSRRGRKWQLVLVCLLASAGALAFNSGSWQAFISPHVSPAQQQPPEGMRAGDTTPTTEITSVIDAPPTPTPARSSAAASSNARPSSTGPSNAGSSNATQASPVRASDLLALAREALRQRDAKRALSRYRELVRRFPNSSEAASVRVTVAQLALQTGSAKEALVGFERYLKSGGSLSPEALAGKVQALTALGRHTAAKQAMREYVARFPNEVHSKGYRRALAQ